MSTRRKVTISLYDVDDLAEIQRLRTEVAKALESEDSQTPGAADTDAEDARIAHNDCVAAARERSQKVTVQAMRWDLFDDLEDNHPPRQIPVDPANPDGETKLHADDQVTGINTRTGGPGLVKACVIDPPDFDPAELSKPSMLRLVFAALRLNRGDEDPKEISAFSDSEPTPDSDDE